MVCAARGTQSFELVRWLGQAYGCKVTSQRLAGAQARSRDVANDYVDLDGGRGAMLRRVVAMARNGLQIGLLQAFLPDYSHIVLLLCGDSKHDSDCSTFWWRHVRGCRTVRSCWDSGGAGCDHAALREVARNGGLVYLDCDVDGAANSKALWAAAEPALDLSRMTNSQW